MRKKVTKKKKKKLQDSEKNAYLQTILKAPVTFQKAWLKTVGGVARTRCLLPIHFCGIRALKTSKLKMRKKVTKSDFRLLRKPHAYLQTILKAHMKFQKDTLLYIKTLKKSRG